MLQKDNFPFYEEERKIKQILIGKMFRFEGGKTATCIIIVFKERILQ